MSSSSLPLKGKTALVTGSSQGIGAAIAHKLASEGANVIVNYVHNKGKADATVKSISGLKGGKAVPVQADVSGVEGGKQLVEETVKLFGSIDILVLNAGIMGSSTLEKLTESFYDSHFSTNVKGPLFLAQAAVPHMPAGGRIIFFSTGLLAQSGITPNYLVYAATKGAVEQLARVLSKELGAKGITVNTVAPGPTATELFLQGKPEQLINGIKSSGPFNRLGEPEDIAEAVAFLASPGAKWVSGTTLRVTGAMIV
ncbi:NAD-P-binding protein [Calocera viscosa TUFC12733]|uniref:NAD-P-binding protein n=1 Tax=Calocera viscosa (strain TUFC12733) TaxID=1330018 RepID=A0A167JT43_CALVF|nr:NAD-P-binding protein [Calocera viscosa TUFC12733]